MGTCMTTSCMAMMRLHHPLVQAVGIVSWEVRGTHGPIRPAHVKRKLTPADISTYITKSGSGGSGKKDTTYL
jgi:hypothetical protein